MVKLVPPGGALPRIFGLPAATMSLATERWVICGSLVVRGCGCLSALLSVPSKPWLWLWLWEEQGFLLFGNHLEKLLWLFVHLITVGCLCDGAQPEV